jgi:uncharacterized protein (DUF433 family)
MFVPVLRNEYDVTVQQDWKNRIVSDPAVLRGKPCIKGTRIPVPLILGYLAAGRQAPEITAEFPGLTTEDVAACLQYARDLSDFEMAPGA